MTYSQIARAYTKNGIPMNTQTLKCAMDRVKKRIAENERMAKPQDNASYCAEYE